MKKKKGKHFYFLLKWNDRRAEIRKFPATVFYVRTYERTKEMRVKICDATK